MKRLIFWTFILFTGAGLGAGGLHVGTHWNEYNPFRDKTGNAEKSLLTKLRQACAHEDGLKGAFVKSAQIADGTLTLKGWVASRDQLVALEAQCHAILDENPDLKSPCASGLAMTEMKVIALHDQLPIWQREFEEGKGAEKNEGDNARKREVMRTTRLDEITFDADGTLNISGVCIRGNTKTDVTGRVLGALLRSRLETVIPADLMPEVALAMHYFPNPAVTLQHRLAKMEQAKGVYVVAAWFNKQGKLTLDVIVRDANQRKLIDDAMGALLEDPQILPMLVAPGTPNAEPSYFLGPNNIVEGAALTRARQKKLVERARKEDKPFLRRVRLTNIVPTAIVNDKLEIVGDDEGNPHYYFRVTGRLLADGVNRKELETELAAVLAEGLPLIANPDQTPIAVKLDLSGHETPLFAMQERAVQRGLDGAVFTEAAYDEEGKLEIAGRLPQAGAKEKQALEDAVRDLLADDAPWTIAALKPHEASKDGQPIAWSAVVRECQAKLASDDALGRRVRLDRLYFNYDNAQLKLFGQGAFLADAAGESPAAALVKSIDAVILTRGKADVSTSAIKSIKNPLPELQNLLTERADLDGVLLTQARFDADGRLIFDGYLGQPEQKMTLAPLLGDKLAANAEVLKKMADPKAPAWSIDALKPHTSAKGEWKWPDVVRACQGELANDAAFQRTCLERAFFQYSDATTGKPRRLILHGKAVSLAKAKDNVEAPALATKLDALAKRLLPDVKFAQAEVDLHQGASPIYELQKLAIAEHHDGFLFSEAVYGPDGKLTFEGLRGDEKETAEVKKMIEQFLAKDKRSLAPAGLADLEKMRLAPWQALLMEIRADFSRGPTPLVKQTRIDRVFFQYDEAGAKAKVHFQGVCIYQGKTPAPDDVPAALADLLKKQLQAKGIDGFELAVAGIERKPNPVIEMQKKANDTGVDGVDFSQIGFDAKGACYIRLPFIPAGQEANITKLIEEAAKKHPHLGGIQQR